MPHFTKRSHRQHAVLWAGTGTYDDDSQLIVGPPVAVRCRWEHGRKETVDAEGQTIAVDATVYLSREVTVGSQLWLAPIGSEDPVEDWYGVGSTGDATQVLRVATVSGIPDLKGQIYEWSAGLQRFRDAPSRAEEE